MQTHLDKIFNSQFRGKSLFDHFCELYQQIQDKQYHGTETLTLFEDLSHFVKQEQFYYEVARTADEVNNPIDEIPPWQEYLKLQMQQLQIKIPALDSVIGYFPRQNQLLNQAGYGFSEEEAYNVQQALKKVAATDVNIKSLRYWGKMLAQHNDYYVMEGTLKQQYTDPMGIDCDDRIQEYVHYVSHDLLGEWSLLPMVTREQLDVSRYITYTFSGDINRQIKQYPKFNGKEKHLLKAQILRITHANLLAPRGLLKPQEEEPKNITFEEEFKMPESAELSTMDAWVHVPPNILKMGRITHYVDANLPEQDKQTILEQLVNDDPEVERLRSIKDDKPFEQNEGNWQIKVMGEVQPFTNQEEGALTYQIVLLRNFLWPGAVTVSNSNEYVSIYVGYGLKNQQQSFNPLAPKDIQDEPEDIEEFPDPNPQTQADEVEPDSDDERRREQELLDAQKDQ